MGQHNTSLRGSLFHAMVTHMPKVRVAVNLHLTNRSVQTKTGNKLSEQRHFKCHK